MGTLFYRVRCKPWSPSALTTSITQALSPQKSLPRTRSEGHSSKTQDEGQSDKLQVDGQSEKTQGEGQSEKTQGEGQTEKTQGEGQTEKTQGEGQSDVSQAENQTVKTQAEATKVVTSDQTDDTAPQLEVPASDMSQCSDKTIAQDTKQEGHTTENVNDASKGSLDSSANEGAIVSQDNSGTGS
jgi:hypothetical protein